MKTASDGSVRQALVLALIGVLLLAPGGCSRSHYRQRADRDAYWLIGATEHATHEMLPRMTIAPDPRSRFFDPNDPDRPPMPPDDPLAHRLMHCVDCKQGFCAWHAGGDTPYVENPEWEKFLPCDEDGQVTINLEGAIALGLVNSRDYQDQLEELYLSALDVSFERFRFDAQFFGGNDTFLTADGRARSGGGGSSSILNTDTSAQMTKFFTSGGELVVGFANRFLWQFSGSNTYTTNTLLDFALVQPLLRAGGRARVMERLTITERALLANVRAMERFRRGYYVEIASGQNAPAGPNRRGGFFGGSGLTGFTGIGGGGFGRVGGVGGGGGGGGVAGGAGAAGAGGYLGLLQDDREIHNQEANVVALRNSLQLMEAFFEANRIDRLQVDLTRQSLYNTQSRLLTSKTSYQSELDNFKFTLGLPPDLCLQIDDDMLEPFNLLSPEMLALETEATTVLSHMWRTSGPSDADEIAAAAQLRQDIRLLEQAGDLLDLAKYLTPQADPAAREVALRAHQARFRTLGEQQAQLLRALGQLRRYPDAMDQARALQQQALEHIGGVGEAFEELEANTPDRISTLQELAQREEVRSGEVNPKAFDIGEFQRIVDRERAKYEAVNQRLAEPMEVWEQYRAQMEALRGRTQEALVQVHEDVDTLRETVDRLEMQRPILREDPDTEPNEQKRAEKAKKLQEFIDGLAQFEKQADQTAARLDARIDALRRYVPELTGVLQTVLRRVAKLAEDATDMGLIQARARLEAVVLTPVQLDEHQAMLIAQHCRRDWRNARSSLVDIWRLIEFNANDLESDLNIIFEGDLNTTGDNPFRFRNTTGRLRMGFEFDAPITRLGERNVYRQSLIEYQQARRSYMAFVDNVVRSLRNTLRMIELNQVNFELRRRAVEVAIDQVELARFRLYEPPRPTSPGAGGESRQFGSTTARDLVSALSDLLSVQNDYLSVWVNYEVQKMGLDLDLGTMQLDDRGVWLNPGDLLGKTTCDGTPLECDSLDDPEVIEPGKPDQEFESLPAPLQLNRPLEARRQQRQENTPLQLNRPLEARRQQQQDNTPSRSGLRLIRVSDVPQRELAPLRFVQGDVGDKGDRKK